MGSGVSGIGSLIWLDLKALMTVCSVEENTDSQSMRIKVTEGRKTWPLETLKPIVTKGKVLCDHVMLLQRKRIAGTYRKGLSLPTPISR